MRCPVRFSEADVSGGGEEASAFGAKNGLWLADNQLAICRCYYTVAVFVSTFIAGERREETEIERHLGSEATGTADISIDGGLPEEKGLHEGRADGNISLHHSPLPSLQRSERKQMQTTKEEVAGGSGTASSHSPHTTRH